LVGQTYENARREFEYLIEQLSEVGALDPREVSQPRQGSWQMVTRTGCLIVTLSVERGAAAVIARGEQPDIICLCEAGIITSYSVFLAAVRRVTRVKGRVILGGTMKDNFGWYASLGDELDAPGNPWRGQTQSLPAWSNTYLYPGGENDPEIVRLRAILPDDEFQRTVAAKKVPSSALIFPEFSYAQHVRPCPFDPALPVHIWIDPGYFPSVYAVIPVQFHGPEVWQIDEIYLNHHTHQQVIAEAKKRPWWGKVQRAVIDFAGRQHHAEQSAEEVWRHLAGKRCHSQQVGILDGIARHRDFLHNKRLIHDSRCRYTLEEYKKYKRPTDRDGNPTDDLPRDENNHSMKAIAYGLVDHFGFVDNRRAESATITRPDAVREMDKAGW
ncbi:MAG TPA: hypothetical protein VJN91_06990, partial [Gammaproteobacteria bacterium]|nr:hypothetical protein [Gammaproteobacteria bacterium]